MIIGLGYKKQSGKDSIADYLCKVHNFKKISFAKALKEGCREIFSLSDDQLYGDLKEVVDDFWGTTPRDILQKVGTDCFRKKFDKNIWIKAAQRKIAQEPNTNWVISDVRFPNEAVAIQQMGGFLVKVNRPKVNPPVFPWYIRLWKNVFGVRVHESETALDGFKNWDYVLQNDIDVHACLYDKVEEMLEYLKDCGCKSCNGCCGACSNE